MFWIYVYKSELNDATSYYLELISRAVGGARITHDITDTGRHDTVIVINPKAFLQVWVRNPRRKIVCWFQGVIPEEVRMSLGDSFKVRMRSRAWSWLEKFALRHAWRVIFVSRAMQRHYEKKYRYKPSGREIIMPCFNLELDATAFEVEGKYDAPTFVYAGGAGAWQCLDETAALFRKIEQEIPEARLILLTSDSATVEEIMRRHGVRNFTISYVPREELARELSKYKYGFMLRRDHVVNNVATPTKFNSYLAAGLIPIYTDAVHDFRDLDIEHRVMLGDMSNHLPLVEFEKRKLDPAQVREDFRTVFNDYYCSEKYIDAIRASLL